MCRNLITVNEKTLPQLLNKMESGKKCLIINTAPTPTVKTTNPLAYFGAKGFSLPEGKLEAKKTLNGLMSTPENCGKVLCEIV